jgi:hypothetical protein
MSGRRARALALGLAALVASATARADSAAPPAPPQPAPRPQPAGADRVELHLRFEPWGLSGRFSLAGASGLADEGLARDDAGFGAQRPVERVLEGSRGTLVLSLSGAPSTPGFPAIFGRWRVVRGTGAYASLAGSGTFTTCGRGEAVKGSPFEIQTLVGHLHPR